MPHGIKSVKKSYVEHLSLYVLFQYKSTKRFYPVLFDREGIIIKDSEHVDTFMNIIRSPKDETALLSEDIKGIDLWTDKCTNNWAAKRSVTPEELTVICVMMLVP